MPLLKVDRVTKRYGDVTAVDDASFVAQPGRITGLLGPNGAGKTSTIRMITFITTPDSGEITLGGERVGRASQEKMGYLPEERGLYRKLKVGEQLVYLARLKGMPAKKADEAARQWLKRFDASDWYSRKVEALSKGMQQKVQFISTVLHNPSLVILDEPFSGLDPINAELLQEVIAELRDDEKTVLFASHRMEQVEQICDDICLMANGKVVLHGPLREIKQQFGTNTVTIVFEGENAWIKHLETEGRIRVLSKAAGLVTARLLQNTSSRVVLDAALKSASDLIHFEVHEPPMNEIFRMTVTGGQQAEQAQETQMRYSR